ncbi:hypothetical protein AJ79_10311 [Helicocarpus griseus UAMH5409]|uniref:Uncharacterized protein n=1 Tax=Helicocarpus griseus UAMH5409 TaxID=1447875 RepID=A0A2B7WEP9_9EURO|nr:hypothetical protein AJ79_10311 [Helicocarpus griseus UAMH5409]
MDELRKVYIQGQVIEDAAGYLQPYFDPSDELYTETSDEILEALESIFHDLNKREKAMNDFQQLFFHKGDDFHPFLMKFNCMA